MSQYDSASLNCSGLLYIPLDSYPIILSLHVEYCFIIVSVYINPEYINKIIPINIETDISNIEEVFGSTGFGFVISFVLKSRVSSMTLISKSPSQLFLNS